MYLRVCIYYKELLHLGHFNQYYQKLSNELPGDEFKSKHNWNIQIIFINPLSANPTKWSNTLNLPTNCLSMFDHFVKLVLKGLREKVFFAYSLYMNGSEFINY